MNENPEQTNTPETSTSEPITFHDLPKKRQIRALQAYSEGWRRAMAIKYSVGGNQGPNRKQRRAARARGSK